MTPTNHSLRYRLDETAHVARWLMNFLNGCRIMTFEGPLGAGKTTLIRALLRELGIHEVVPSPTFTYVTLFQTPHGKTIYHFDLYRITSINEFIAAGFDEYLADKDALIFIEWPEVIQPLLDKLPVCSVSIEHETLQERILTIKHQ